MGDLMNPIKIQTFFVTMAVFFAIGSCMFLWSAATFNDASSSYFDAGRTGDYDYHMNKGNELFERGELILNFGTETYLPIILPVLTVLSFLYIFRDESRKLKQIVMGRIW